MNRRFDDRAVSQIVDFLIGMTVFIVVLMLFLLFTPTFQGGTDAQDRASVARGLVDSLITRPGLATGYHGVDWEHNPDDVGLLGLRRRDSTLLSYPKIAALARGGPEAEPNHAVDYPEARQALGLTHLETRYDVELHIQPRPFRNASVLDTGLASQARLAYLGDHPQEIRALENTSLVFDAQDDVYDPSDDASRDELLLDLPVYDVMVVGSTVDHSELDRPDVRDRFASWVRAGGGLAVLGNDAPSAAWLGSLAPTLTVAGKSGTVAVVGPDEPLINVPHDLEADAYDPVFTGGDPVVWSATETRFHAAVALEEDPGNFTAGAAFPGAGTLVPTSYRPRLIRDELGRDESRRFQANLVHLAATGAANLVYGEPPIQEARAATITRDVVVQHPVLGAVRAQLSLTVWGG